MKISFARWTIVLLIFHLAPIPAPPRELGWQPEKTWLFVVGVLSWKHSEMFGSFPVKNRRDAALVEFFKQSGVPDSQIVYLQDNKATQQRIDAAFTGQLKISSSSITPGTAPGRRIATTFSSRRMTRAMTTCRAGR